jgi:hypothetical protein
MPLISTKNRRYLQGQARRDRYEQYKEALQYCKDNGCGAKAAIKAGQWNDVHFKALQQRLNGHVVNGAEDESRSLLLFVEEQQLMKWMKECGDNMMGRNRPDVQAKILEILKERKGRLRAARGKGYTKLSTAAQDLLEKSIPTMHSHWFQRFYGFWHFEISEKAEQSVDKKRVAKYTETTVKRHFNAPAGLKSTFIKHGIMDPATGAIRDPRRVLNRDEMPQSLDYSGGKKGGKDGVSKEKPAASAHRESRECATIDMVQDLSGFLYGCHLILARSTLTASLGPEEASVFDNNIRELEGYSTFCLVSLMEKGSQTGVTLLERYKMLDQELTARDVERPVVEMTDNHVSRYSDEVMEFCNAHGIIQWSEESQTSAIFQALYQNNQ